MLTAGLIILDIILLVVIINVIKYLIPLRKDYKKMIEKNHRDLKNDVRV